MANNIIGREDYNSKISVFSESNHVGNQAFLGLKGVGKTSLFQNYFSRSKRSDLALKYKKLFVYTRLDSRKQGVGLYQFLLDQVKMGIMAIPNSEDKTEIMSELPTIDAFFETPDGRLDQYLSLIKDKGYDLILIMDQFHCMARDSEIGKEQYDVLRSFNEQKLIIYWIITDTDLMETCATEQYVASFFAQKFTSKLTINPVNVNDAYSIAKTYIEDKNIDISEDTIHAIAEISGGIPQIIFMAVDMLPAYIHEKEFSTEEYLHFLINNDGCSSLMNSWTDGLTNKQKELIYSVVISDEGYIDESELVVESSKMAELADAVGRGLLHSEKKDDTRTWSISVPLFKSYIIEMGDVFYVDKIAESTETVPVPPAGSVTNIYNITGNYIQSQTNNILNIENAVAGLEDLQRLMSGNPYTLDMDQASKKLEYLPFQQEVWDELEAEEQEEELEKYADGIFASELFSSGELTNSQLVKFSLNEDLMQQLTPACRTQIICGIQVYELIQTCIERFGLNMNESESPRGILFARSFERHLKDCVYPAFCNIDEFSTQKIRFGNKSVVLKDHPIDRTTIGTYTTMMDNKKSFDTLASLAVEGLGYNNKDANWWRSFTKILKEIGGLRNDCCHSGTQFDSKKLKGLINLIFEQESIGNILVFNEMRNLSMQTSVYTSNGSKGQTTIGLDLTLLGKEVTFLVQKKSGTGAIQGIIDGGYPASLPKNYASKYNFVDIKNKKIKVKVASVMGDRFMLML